MTAKTAKRAGKRSPTKWGDREQRRVDILDAARDKIAGGGYLSLNMRDLAADAGISPATLYSYFATKEELFATLYAEAIRAHTAAFRPVVEAELPLVPLLRAVVVAHLELYRSYGQHFTLWSALRHDEESRTNRTKRVPRELIDELRDATFDHYQLQMSAIREAAERSGRRVVDERFVPSFVWATLTGLADHVTSERRSLDPYPAEELFDFSAARLAEAITVPR
jgi:AcrR family transcriptional regulator